MKWIVFQFVFVVYLIHDVCPRPKSPELVSEKFSQSPDVLSFDPRYRELAKQAEKIVKMAMQNVTVETGKLMNTLINRIDKIYNELGNDSCSIDAKEKLINIKGSALKEFGPCKHRIKLEELSWALAIKAAQIRAKLKQAGEESLSFCMTKNKSKSVVCRINPADETSKRFEALEVEVQELEEEAKKMYPDYFIPFAKNCFDEEKFNNSIQEVQSSCPN